MKKILFALLSLWVGVALAQDFESVDPSGQSISFWHQHSGEREEALKQIVTDFNSSNEWGITVTAEYQGNYSDIFQKMLPLLGTADAPNLVVAYQNQAASYKLADGVLDLNSLVNSSKWGYTQEDLADFFQAFIDSDVFPTFNNERLGFPPNRSMEVLYYNADWLQELGYDAPPATPEAFKEMACKAAQQPFSKATSEGSLGYELSIDASRFASWTFAFGGDIFDGSQYTLNSNAAVEAMTFVQSLFIDGCASIVTEDFGDQTNFGAGRTLFTVGSSSGLPFYGSAVSEGANFQWRVAPIPHTTPDPVQNIYGASVSIPSGHTPEANLATWLFIKYYTSPEVQATWASASQYFPVRESVAEGLSDYFATNPSYKTAFDLLLYGKAEPSTPGYEFVRDLIQEKMTVIADGEDVASTLASMNEEANKILSDQSSPTQ
jgi:multiple sugar transport system substrate-binding protein